MNILLLARIMTSLKKELLIVLAVMASLIVLPVVAIVSVVDVDLKAFADPKIRMYQGPASTTNTYTFGYCTFWAAKRREETGKPIPNTWGDAHTWDDRAARDGYRVDNIPTVGAIMETDEGQWGHVAYVEKVEPDGRWTISEMNAPIWNVVTHRTFTAAQAQGYKFIH